MARKNYKGAIHRFPISKSQVKDTGEDTSNINLYREDLYRLYEAFPRVLRDFLMEKGYE
nr:MAG TPA: hypothetical protein [Caudoviricetes sp.]